MMSQTIIAYVIVDEYINKHLQNHTTNLLVVFFFFLIHTMLSKTLQENHEIEINF